MPPPIDHPSLALSLLDNVYVVRKLETDKVLPESVLKLFSPNNDETFVSITRTSEEISIVSSIDNDSGDGLPKWKCIKIKGPMEFGMFIKLSSTKMPLHNSQVVITAKALQELCAILQHLLNRQEFLYSR